MFEVPSAVLAHCGCYLKYLSLNWRNVDLTDGTLSGSGIGWMVAH